MLLDHYEKCYFRFITEPYVGTTGKCHQQRLASDKKTTAPLPQQQRHTHCQQSPLPTLVTPPEDSQQTPQQQATVAMRPVGCAELEDLIHLAGPLTEDAVLKCLQARFCASQFFVSISCLLLAAYFGSTTAFFSSSFLFPCSLFVFTPFILLVLILLRLHLFRTSFLILLHTVSSSIFYSSLFLFIFFSFYFPFPVFTIFCFTSHIIYYPTYFNSYSAFPCTTVSYFLFFLLQSITFLIILLLFHSSPSFLMFIHHFISPLLLFISLIIAYFFLPSIFPSVIYSSSSSSSSIVHYVFFFSVFLLVFIPLAFSQKL